MKSRKRIRAKAAERRDSTVACPEITQSAIIAKSERSDPPEPKSYRLTSHRVVPKIQVDLMRAATQFLGILNRLFGEQTREESEAIATLKKERDAALETLNRIAAERDALRKTVDRQELDRRIWEDILPKVKTIGGSLLWRANEEIARSAKA